MPLKFEPPFDMPSNRLLHRSGHSLSASRSIVLWFALATFVLCWSVTGLPHAAAQEAPTPDSASVSVGFHGHSRLGAWFPIFVKTAASQQPARYEIDSIDGDGYRVTISGDIAESVAGQHECSMQTGRAFGERQVRLFDSENQIVGQAAFNLNQSAPARTLHPSTRPLMVVLSSTKVIAESISPPAARSQQTTPAVVTLSDTAQLPSHWLNWQAVETLVICGSDLDLMRYVTEVQWDAIETWLENGGRLVVSAGVETDTLLGDAGILNRFCPGTYAGEEPVKSSSRIEFFANADEQLIARGGEPLLASKTSDVQGSIRLKQDDLPLVVSQPRRFGQSTFVAFDLNDQRLQNWKGYSGLLDRILTPNSKRADAKNRSRDALGSSVSHVGYTDLAGQLRVPLDQFSSVRFVSFTWVAVLIGAYILCIGPGDYFLLRKLIGRMEMTWLTFPLVSLLFCGIALGISRFARPTTSQLNQLEIIDFDEATATVRGNLWTHFYSPEGNACSIQLPATNDLKISLDQRITSWQGLPGDGLGGMQTRAGTTLLGQQYQQTINRTPLSNETPGLEVSIVDQPQRVSSTRAMFSQWWGDSPFSINSQLKYNRRIKRLDGTFTNPLDQPIKNCRLHFDNYVYLLPRSLAAGETIDVMTEMRENTARGFLNRRTKEHKDSNKGRNLPWNPTSTNMNRIADMLMFYQAAGGGEYTGLTHSYQPFIDLSDQLNLSRAILVGNLDGPVTQLELDGVSAANAYDSSTTVVRIIFPVENR